MLHGSLAVLLENSQAPLVFHHPACMERVWLGEGTRYPQCSCGETVCWGGGIKVPRNLGTELQLLSKSVNFMADQCAKKVRSGVENVPRTHFFVLSLCSSHSDETFDLGLRFELVMEVRPRVASSVLLHVRTAEGYFTMYIHQGEVRHWDSHLENCTHSGQVKYTQKCIFCSKLWIQHCCVCMCVSRLWLL